MAEIQADMVLIIMLWLHQAHILSYLSGGWGIDALVGYQTRVHTDVDIAFDATREMQLLQMFADAGYKLREDARPVRFVLGDEKGHLIDFHPVRFEASGTGIQRGFEGMFVYPAHDLIEGIIAGVAVPCISAELQVCFHEGYSPTEKDCADMKLLHHMCGVRLPASYAECTP